MQRENIVKIFAKGAGFMLFGNILGGVMTVSLAPVITEWFIPYIALLLTVFIYASLLFTAGWRDGLNEAVMLRNKRVESIPKNRWLILGLILWAVMCIPCVILMIGMSGAIRITGEYLFAFRFICGTVYPLMHIGELQSLPAEQMPLWYPLACMGIYLVFTPASAQIGYRVGCQEKTSKDFMYEKK